MQYKTHRDFDKQFQALPKNIRAKFAKALLYFIQDQFHPSLHTKKMQGVKGVWEVRVDRSYRFTFHYEIDDEGERICCFRSIGPHDILDKNP